MKVEEKVAITTVPRDITLLEKSTGNIYESISIIGKRANQIAAKTKEEIQQAMADFNLETDNLEEIQENQEQIALSMQYETLAKPTLQAIHEFVNGEVYFRKPDSDNA